MGWQGVDSEIKLPRLICGEGRNLILIDVDQELKNANNLSTTIKVWVEEGKGPLVKEVCITGVKGDWRKWASSYNQLVLG